MSAKKKVVRMRDGCAGTDNGRSKLRDAQVVKIRQERAAGAKVRALAKRYGVSHVMVSRIVRGRAWTHVGGPIQLTLGEWVEQQRETNSMSTRVANVLVHNFDPETSFGVWARRVNARWLLSLKNVSHETVAEIAEQMRQSGHQLARYHE